jgi:methylmalonyl-CoA mutase N-terminal domain/subunit
VALQALSAVLGGTQSLHTNASDEALALPTEQSARLALRTQQVIASETGVADVADPLGGSHLVEAWTAEIRERARSLIRKVDELGGAVAAIEHGFFQKEIEDAAYTAQRELEDGKRLTVGVNAFREENEIPPPILAIDPEIEIEQLARLSAFRASRDAPSATRALARLQSDAREDRNLMPALVEAVTRHATLGEIVKSLKEIYGEHRPGR